MMTWLNRLAWVSLLGFPVAVIASRFDIVHFRFGLLLVLLSLLIALVVVAVGIGLYFKHRKHNSDKSRSARNAIFLSAIPLIGIGSSIIGARDLPQIHNITTDTQDPPSFDKIHDLRTSEHNSLSYDADQLAPQQQSAYPNIKTRIVTLSKAEAHTRALTVIDQLGWQLVSENQQQGLIEASETTLLWGFTDDIVIRLRSNPNDDQVEIDLRSVSRVGVSDLGANAERIEKFLSAF